jgi:hypothetical protein
VKLWPFFAFGIGAGLLVRRQAHASELGDMPSQPRARPRAVPPKAMRDRAAVADAIAILKALRRTLSSDQIRLQAERLQIIVTTSPMGGGELGTAYNELTPATVGQVNYALGLAGEEPLTTAADTPDRSATIETVSQIAPRVDRAIATLEGRL